MSVSDFARSGGFSSKRIEARQRDELIGAVKGILADGNLLDEEIFFLRKWAVANEEVMKDPVIAAMIDNLFEILKDGEIDEEERLSFAQFLSEFAGNDFEEGEPNKSTTAFFDNPEPKVIFEGMNFEFTGSFTGFTRRECKEIVRNLGSTAEPLAMCRPGYLVVGEYSTDAWLHSSYGTKIQKAVLWRDRGENIAIISQAHWQAACGV